MYNLSVLPESPEDAALQAHKNATTQMIEWATECLQQAPSNVGEFVELEAANTEDNYSGTFLLRTSCEEVVWVGVEDDGGWDLDEPGELDDDGNIVVEAQGHSTTHTKIVELSKRPLVIIEITSTHADSTILGLGYAFMRITEENDEYPSGHYWRYVRNVLQDCGIQL